MVVVVARTEISAQEAIHCGSVGSVIIVRKYGTGTKMQDRLGSDGFYGGFVHTRVHGPRASVWYLGMYLGDLD